MSRPIALGIRRAALPLACYYAVTLGLPVANGAAGTGPAFARHALVVIVVPILLIAFVSSTCEIAGRVWNVHYRR